MNKTWTRFAVRKGCVPKSDGLYSSHKLSSKHISILLNGHGEYEIRFHPENPNHPPIMHISPTKPSALSFARKHRDDKKFWIDYGGK